MENHGPLYARQALKPSPKIKKRLPTISQTARDAKLALFTDAHAKI